MDERNWLAERFEADRARLRGVAYRMLGSLSEADDAVQEAWLRLSRADAGEIDNLNGWLTTVVGRIALDMLRSRASRREDSLGGASSAPLARGAAADDPEQEAILADSVGLAMMVVLDTLTPAERLAFVLHDMFAVPFDDIAPIVGRTPAAARQLASRARRRVQGPPALPDADLDRQRAVVDAFLAAARGGDFAALLKVLAPDVVLRGDRVPTWAGAPEVRGAEVVARQAVRGGARAARPALINGAVGVVVAPRGRLLMALAFTIEGDQVVSIDVIAEPDRLRHLDLAVLDE